MLPAVIERIPPPRGNTGGDLRLLLFDAFHDEYRWVACQLVRYPSPLYPSPVGWPAGLSAAVQCLTMTHVCGLGLLGWHLWAGQLGCLHTGGPGASGQHGWDLLSGT